MSRPDECSLPILEKWLPLDHYFVHRNPAQLSVLQEKGFSVIAATHGSQGLRLLVSKPVDAVVLEYHLGLMDGAAVAHEIKKVRPRLPIVMLAETLDLPEDVLKSVDALVIGSDGPRFLLGANHTVLQAKERFVQFQLRQDTWTHRHCAEHNKK